MVIFSSVPSPPCVSRPSLPYRTILYYFSISCRINNNTLSFLCLPVYLIIFSFYHTFITPSIISQYTRLLFPPLFSFLPHSVFPGQASSPVSFPPHFPVPLSRRLTRLHSLGGEEGEIGVVRVLPSLDPIYFYSTLYFFSGPPPSPPQTVAC